MDEECDKYLIKFVDDGKASFAWAMQEWSDGVVETRRAVLVFSSEEKAEAHIKRSAQTNAEAGQPERPLRVHTFDPSEFRWFLRGSSAKYFVEDIVAPAIVGPSTDVDTSTWTKIDEYLKVE